MVGNGLLAGRGGDPIGDYEKGIMGAAFGAMWVGVGASGLTVPEWDFYEGCIRFMAQRVGFATSGECRLALAYGRLLESIARSTTPEGNLQDDVQAILTDSQ